MGLDRRAFTLGAGATLGTGVLAAGSASFPSRLLAAPVQVRVAALRYGSLNWLLETIRNEGLDKKAGIEMDVRKLATSPAGPVALMAGEADVIVSDWPWAMRQRSRGETLKFAPYSGALGAVMIGPQSEMKTLADLKGKRLAVAGSSVDKSWIMLQAYCRQQHGVALTDLVSPIFGAPPLLSQEMMSGRVDAVLNFWTYTARLKGNGFKPLVTMGEVMEGLGVKPVVPMVGFVWGKSDNQEGANRFLEAARMANDVLKTSDEAFERLRPLMKPKSEGEFEALKAAYREGIPGPWTQEHTDAAGRLLALLRELGDKDLVGAETTFDPELFRSTV